MPLPWWVAFSFSKFSVLLFIFFYDCKRSKVIREFKSAIQQGKYANAVRHLSDLGLPNKRLRNTIAFMLQEQQYMEYLAQNDIQQALKHLQNELRNAVYDGETKHRLHVDASFLMCTTDHDLQYHSG